MKFILCFLPFLIASSSFASSYGKFKLETSNFLSGNNESLVFLLNSKGEIKILEKSSYSKMSVTWSPNQTTLKFQGQGDEDYTSAFFLLTDNEIIAACSVIVDEKNNQIELEDSSHRLSRWSKTLKKYVLIPDDTSAKHLSLCQYELSK